MKKKKKGGVIFLLIFLIGLGILLYPFVSQYIHKRLSRAEIHTYEREVQNLSQSERDYKYQLAEAYNETLVIGKLSDPWGELHEEGVKEYARMLEVHEKIGFVEIPSINQEIPIYAGTSESGASKRSWTHGRDLLTCGREKYSFRDHCS